MLTEADERLAERVRGVLAPEGPPDERRMFGGLAFMVEGSMSVCVSGQGGLMVRVDRNDLAGLVEQPDVEAMTMAGRVSRTWVRVASRAVDDDASLEAWVARGVASVRALS